MLFLKMNNEINRGAILTLVVLLIWKFFILWVLTVPGPPSGFTGPVFFDKVVHFSLFGVLAFFVFALFILMENEKFESVMIAFSWSVMYSAFCEYLQSFLVYRDASFYDFLAGLLGAATIIVIAQFRGGFLHREISKKPRILLHICCAACGAYVAQLLQKDYQVVLYYYNSNMHPVSEHKKRLMEVKKIAQKYKLELICGVYDHRIWLRRMKGLEYVPEGGSRCVLCFEDRLKKTAREAKKRNFDFFTTSLTISPHKDFVIIKNIGLNLEKKYGVRFLVEDFKKDGGFQGSVKLSRELKLYRQNYCGCEFSKNN